jgi:uncharacterized protein DUF3501
MKPLTKDDLIPYVDYERIRNTFRQRIIELKRRRRLTVGEKITLLFENRDTIQFQIQEMIRAERIFDPAKVQDELDVYNALLPADRELSATLFIEITESERLKEDLDSFQGIDRGKTVAIGTGSHLVYGEFEGGHSKEDKISAVHFVRFRPTAEFLDAIKDSPLSIVVNHSAYQAEALVPEAMRQEWMADLGLSMAAQSSP